MAIVKTNDSEWFGRSLTIFAAGTVVISKEGEFEIPDECVTDVTETYPHISLIEGEIPPAPIVEDLKGVIIIDDPKIDEELIKEKSESDELNEGDAEEEENAITSQGEAVQVESEASDEKATMIAALDSKTRAELQALCATFPRKEWGSLNKEDLINYLKAKLA